MSLQGANFIGKIALIILFTPCNVAVLIVISHMIVIQAYNNIILLNSIGRDYK